MSWSTGSFIALEKIKDSLFSIKHDVQKSREGTEAHQKRLEATLSRIADALEGMADKHSAQSLELDTEEFRDRARKLIREIKERKKERNDFSP